ncbi:MoaD/ThiS family protein [Acinetobacter cumulans]|uniref:MoaD/ThiS family protein n=1 Tax=Acinetobacter cumulans TaxID=2136182 RepID=A0ABX9UAX2_9GAMM|nr:MULTISPECIES: MoaD/ThiS family protein [Acinetobacter]RFS30913.1 MoaD/ThiS family protein [Acinetobacter sp. SWAC5]RKG46874.1 MoaD/ThiS family protein [Acinetobacter cumulans]RLL49901.1 MoaD/ThiS family protein [Acinetobacter cumulans]RZG62269.1 MoaD/ThiS family protein [Acinetobacter sp. WCHAc060006]
MHSINICIEAFGAIEKQLPQELTFECEFNATVAEVLNMIVQTYPQVEAMLERCACAIGEDIISRQQHLTQNSTVVLLSPVAGG